MEFNTGPVTVISTRRWSLPRLAIALMLTEWTKWIYTYTVHTHLKLTKVTFNIKVTVCVTF